MGHKVIQPEGWVKPKGYANGVLGAAGGQFLFVAGQIGWKPDGTFAGPDFLSQFEQALKNVVSVVEAAGGSASDICRIRTFVVNKQDYLKDLREVGRLWKETIGRHYPAMAFVEVSSLMEDEALLEIEATAVISNA